MRTYTPPSPDAIPLSALGKPDKKALRIQYWGDRSRGVNGARRLGTHETVPNTTWEQIGMVSPDALVSGRLELHHAAQLAAGVGASLLDPRPDDSQPNLGWRDRSRGWVGHAIPARRSFAAVLRPDDLTLLLEDDAGATLAELDLVGRTLAEGREWLGEQTRALGAIPRDGAIHLPGYDLPAHPVGSGGRFAGELAPERAELGRWFAAAHGLLVERAARETDASEVRCWPHHFDIATLITVERDDAGAATRTVGVGLSPGDERYAEPYWYVSPWPAPSSEALPFLDCGGRWQIEGFTAAILLGSEVASAGTGAARSKRVGAFIDGALSASHRLLSQP
jgi:hypothetical protein